jgi:hypothetical protein
MNTLKKVGAYIVARAHEVSSILAASGAGAVLVAYATGQMDGKKAAVAGVAAVIMYLMPEDKALVANVANAISPGAVKTTALALALALGIGSGLVACSSAPAPATQPSSGLLTFAKQAGAYVADFNSKVAAFNSGALTDAKVLGQAACGAGSMADGVFKAATPIILAAGVDPSVGATEAGAALALNLACQIVDNANPATPVTTVASAAMQAVNAYQQVKTALSQGAPTVAAAATPVKS